jgi:antitoxin VapB
MPSKKEDHPRMTSGRREVVPVEKARINRAKLAAIIAEANALPRINENLTDDEIIGYDEHGVPR